MEFASGGPCGYIREGLGVELSARLWISRGAVMWSRERAMAWEGGMGGGGRS